MANLPPSLEFHGGSVVSTQRPGPVAELSDLRGAHFLWMRVDCEDEVHWSQGPGSVPLAVAGQMPGPAPAWTEVQ